MAMFHFLKIRTSKDIFSNEKCKVNFGLKYIIKSAVQITYVPSMICAFWL